MEAEEQSDRRGFCRIDQRTVRIAGLTVGWFGVLLSFILIYALCKHPGLFGKSLHETIIPFLPCEFRNKY